MMIHLIIRDLVSPMYVRRYMLGGTPEKNYIKGFFAQICV